ncbi:hypothetical protein JHN53_15050 [Streptomyces sp. MBT58]|uniref:hypothetical protein n=1 Tax=Streptomyces sp. MBT58 TaxID=1488389 RepID=UPI001912EFB8|nr:hypothetical protein [Streptomyces sp. MBT58]MBK5992928.1 hypothetical protein [Streptomyces sp. MBT58]
MALFAVRQVPVQASGDAEDGPVSIGVIGGGLRVRKVRVLLNDGGIPFPECSECSLSPSQGALTAVEGG